MHFIVQVFTFVVKHWRIQQIGLRLRLIHGNEVEGRNWKHVVFLVKISVTNEFMAWNSLKGLVSKSGSIM